MKIYLLRHGHSPTLPEAGVVYDADRPLSEAGRAAVRRTIGLLLERGGRPSLILHSPLRRAAESARAAAAALKDQVGIESFEPLSNALSAPELYERLTERVRGLSEEVLAVGHQPQLGELTAYLTGRVLELRAGGLIALETVEADKARALWSSNPQEGPIA